MAGCRYTPYPFRWQISRAACVYQRTRWMRLLRLGVLLVLQAQGRRLPPPLLSLRDWVLFYDESARYYRPISGMLSSLQLARLHLGVRCVARQSAAALATAATCYTCARITRILQTRQETAQTANA